MATDVAPNQPQKEHWKVAFRSMFHMGIKSQRFGATSFSNLYYTLHKNPCATRGTVLDRAQKTLCHRSQFHTFFLPHRFVKISLFRQHWICHNLLDMSRFQNFPEWIQNKKVAEMCEFDGKRTAVPWKNHGHLKKSFGMKALSSFLITAPPCVCVSAVLRV